MKKELIKLANHLDRIGLTKEADFVDNILKKAEDADSNEDTSRFTEILLDCEEWPPAKNVEVEYIGFENAYDQTYWKFKVNEKEIKYIGYTYLPDIAKTLAAAIGIEAGKAVQDGEIDYTISAIWWDTGDYPYRSQCRDRAFELALEFLKNIKVLPSDMEEAERQMREYADSQYYGLEDDEYSEEDTE